MDYTRVLLRRFPVPKDRKPRRILPGDYFFVLLDGMANYGKVSLVVSYFEHSFVGTAHEITVDHYKETYKAFETEVPPQLLTSIDEVEPKRPMKICHRLNYANLIRMWEN